MVRKTLRRKGKRIARALLVILILALALLLLAYFSNLFLGEGGPITDFFQEWTKKNRVLSYFLYLIIAPLINLLPGISSMFTIGLANMFFNYRTPEAMMTTFGLCATSVVLTSSLMFLLGRVGGKRLVEWIAGRENTEKLKKYLTIGGKAVIPMMYTLPFFPDDTICLIAGMSDMSFLYNFLCTLIFRNFGVLFMCVVGTIDYSTFTWQIWLGAILAFLLLLALLSFLSFLYYRHLRFKEEGRRYLLSFALFAKEKYRVERAKRKDLKTISSLYEWGRKKMKEEGNGNQWDGNYPSLRNAKEDFYDDGLYVLKKGQETIGCMTLLPEKEEDFENPALPFRGKGDYSVLHRLVSKEKGGGRRLLEAAKKKSKALRTDTFFENAEMVRLLEKEGFCKIGSFERKGHVGTFLAFEYLERQEGKETVVEKVE